jgi:undecaprenyl-diphosphatase
MNWASSPVSISLCGNLQQRKGQTDVTIVDAIILGFVQGASEFLPISSSAHLVIAQGLLHVNEPSIFLEVALHVGTLLSVLIYFRRDVIELLTGFFAYLLTRKKTQNERDFRLSTYIIIASIPAAVGGLLFKDWFEQQFESASFSGYMLLITATILLLTWFARNRKHPVNAVRALIIGVAQFCAILGITPREAARFSFLLSLPAVFGAALLKTVELRHAAFSSGILISFAIGAFVSFLVGIAAIHYLLKIVSSRHFYLFGFYCLLAGIFTILYF